MPIQIKAVDGVTEGKVQDSMGDFAQVGANIITVINDGKGTFSVEGTFIDPGPQGTITTGGKMSLFGGPNDHGVGAGEGLALFDLAELTAAPADLFLPDQPPGTTGLARRLNPNFNYLAYRWDYSLTPRDFLRQNLVTVSANGKSVAAQPVDWGPNIDTNRIADLSPGLAHTLGLDTDDTCNLAIPLPAGTNVAVPASPPATGVDLATVDAKTFPPNMTRTLVVLTTSNNTTYWVLNVIGPNEGGQTLRRQVGNNPPESLLSDTVILPLTASAQVPAAVVAELNKAVQKEPDVHATPAGPAPGAGDDINAKVFAAAVAFIGHITKNVPDTDGGILACAWAENEVVRRALGRPISTENGGANGLSTVGIFEALQAHHTPLALNQVVPGAVVISPTQGSTHGHVGIVGANPGGAASNTQILSNSSRHGKFEQNYTISSWTAHYTGLGLQVLFFALNRNQFT